MLNELIKKRFTYRCRSSSTASALFRAGWRIALDCDIGVDALGRATAAVFGITGARGIAVRSLGRRARRWSYVGAPALLALKYTIGITFAGSLTRSVRLVVIGDCSGGQFEKCVELHLVTRTSRE